MSSLILIGVELGAAALLCGVLYILAQLTLRRIPAKHADWRRAAALNVRNLPIGIFVALLGFVIATNAYLFVRGVDPGAQATGYVRSNAGAVWAAIASGLLKLTL